MDEDLRAWGVVVTIFYAPPGMNGNTNLVKALDYAAVHDGLTLELKTWGPLPITSDPL